MNIALVLSGLGLSIAVIGLVGSKDGEEPEYEWHENEPEYEWHENEPPFIRAFIRDPGTGEAGVAHIRVVAPMPAYNTTAYELRFRDKTVLSLQSKGGDANAWLMTWTGVNKRSERLMGAYLTAVRAYWAQRERPWPNSSFLFQNETGGMYSFNQYGDVTSGSQSGGVLSDLPIVGSFADSVFRVALPTAKIVLPWVPGVGPVALYAVNVAIAVGEGESLKDAALKEAESLVPGQYKWAYHLAVGVANGEPADEAAIKAALSYAGPEYVEWYNFGCQTMNSLTGKKCPVQYVDPSDAQAKADAEARGERVFWE